MLDMAYNTIVETTWTCHTKATLPVLLAAIKYAHIHEIGVLYHHTPVSAVMFSLVLQRVT